MNSSNTTSPVDTILRAVAAALQECDPPTLRRWFYADGIEAYVRAGVRPMTGNPGRTLDLANVEIAPALQGQRLFSALLDGLQALAADRRLTLVVENVLSDIVRGAVLRRGYTPIAPHTYAKL